MYNKLLKSRPDWFSSMTIRVKTPDGTMYVHILENEKELPVKIMVSAGKCGTSFSVWADATCHMISELLTREDKYGDRMSLAAIISMLSEFHTDKSIRDHGIQIRSGVHGLKVALLTYMNDKSIKNSILPGQIHGRATFGVENRVTRQRK